MSYSNPDARDYVFGAVSFATNTTRKIRGPKGKKGYLRAVHAMVTTSFVGTSTAAVLGIGVSGTTSAYGALTFGAAGAGTAAGNVLASDDGVTTTYVSTLRELPADTDILLTCTAGTGGTPAGVADLMITIEWDD